MSAACVKNHPIWVKCADQPKALHRAPRAASQMRRNAATAAASRAEENRAWGGVGESSSICTATWPATGAWAACEKIWGEYRLPAIPKAAAERITKGKGTEKRNSAKKAAAAITQRTGWRSARVPILQA